MNSRNVVFLLVAVILGLSGVLATFIGGMQFGVAAILVFHLLHLVLALLERRQTAKTQQRILRIVKSNDAVRRELRNLDFVSRGDIQKIAGLVQAQQISLEEVATSLESRHSSAEPQVSRQGQN